MVSVEENREVRAMVIATLKKFHTWFFFMTVMVVGEQLAFAYTFTFLYLKGILQI